MTNSDLCSLWEQRLAEYETSGKTISSGRFPVTANDGPPPVSVP